MSVAGSGGSDFQLSMVADALASGFAVADVGTWQVRWASRKFEQWFPAQGDLSLLARLPGLDEERARKRLARGRAFPLQTELRDGARTTVVKTTLRIVEIEGQQLLLVEVTDITKQKEQEHMLDSFASLADRNKIQLERANAALEEKNRQIEAAYALIKVQKDRMQRELQVAREVQQNMMPHSFLPTDQECTVAATLVPALEVGGDFFDFFYVDEHRLCFLLGDVSDKGAASGLFMAAAKTLVKSYSSRAKSTAGVVARVNEELSKNNESMMFVTLFCAILDLRSGEVVMTNAGHEPPYLLRSGQSPEVIRDRDGLPLGVVEDGEYGERTLSLRSGDLMLVYSDGVTDATCSGGKAFGHDGIAAVLANLQPLTVEGIVRDLASMVRQHEQGTAQSDDVTILAVQFHGPPQ